jgi:hypothetical protein
MQAMQYGARYRLNTDEQQSGSVHPNTALALTAGSRDPTCLSSCDTDAAGAIHVLESRWKLCADLQSVVRKLHSSPWKCVLNLKHWQRTLYLCPGCAAS